MQEVVMQVEDLQVVMREVDLQVVDLQVVVMQEVDYLVNLDYLVN